MFKSRFIQTDCAEDNQVDLRQANVIKKYKPDMIFFEYPTDKNNPAIIFNGYDVKSKPFLGISKITKNLTRSAKKFPYALSDVQVWKNIEFLWQSGKNTLVFNIDSPKELRAHDYAKYGQIPYSIAIKQWRFWVFLYIRECYMVDNIKKILKKQPNNKKKVIAIFLQKIHWDHVKFLLKNPSKKAIWKFYFDNFPEITSSNINQKIKKEDKIYYKYWKKISVFVE